VNGLPHQVREGRGGGRAHSLELAPSNISPQPAAGFFLGKAGRAVVKFFFKQKDRKLFIINGQENFSTVEINGLPNMVRLTSWSRDSLF
jgi:hypothetical protein